MTRKRSTSIEMFSTFIFILLCVSPLAVTSYDYQTPKAIQNNVPPRSEQCQRRFPFTLGECTIGYRKNYLTYLEDESCQRLWCIVEENNQYKCAFVGRPDEFTVCGVSKYCSEGMCVQA